MTHCLCKKQHEPDAMRCEAALAACIVCGEPAVCHKPGRRGYDIYVCGGCRLEFCRPMPTDKDFARCYGNYSDPRAAWEVVVANAERHISRLKGYGLDRESRLLDYGSGQGAFCQVGGSDRWRGYDPFTEDADKSVLREGYYDWVTLWGVLEHVSDPGGLLRELGGYLRQGGMAALTTVSTETSIPFQYKPPEHVTYWTRGAIEAVLERSGFVLIDYGPYEMIQKSEVYLSAVLRTVPAAYRGQITHSLPDWVEVPTNEVFVTARKG